jgi:lipopolysaccharide export system permease protein
MAVPFLIGQCAIVMMLTGSVLYNNANLFVQFQVPFVMVFRLALFFIPFLINMTMPVAMAVAASLAISRLSRDSEITVMRAAGISLFRIFLPVFCCGLVISVADFYFGEFVVPGSIVKYEQVLGQLETQFKNLMPLAGQTVALDGKTVVGVRSMTAHPGFISLQGISINSTAQMLNGSTQPFLAVATTGTYSNGTWTLNNPVVIAFNPDNPATFTQSTSRTISYKIPVDPQFFQSGFQLQMPMGQMAQSSMLTFSQLGKQLAQDRKNHYSDPSRLLDYNFKMSVPFSCLVMALCCPPIAMKFGKGGGFVGTLLSICLVFVYWNTLLLARILGSPGPQGSAPLLSPVVAAWSQNVLFAACGIWLLKRSE